VLDRGLTFGPFHRQARTLALYGGDLQPVAIAVHDQLHNGQIQTGATKCLALVKMKPAVRRQCSICSYGLSRHLRRMIHERLFWEGVPFAAPCSKGKDADEAAVCLEGMFVWFLCDHQQGYQNPP